MSWYVLFVKSGSQLKTKKWLDLKFDSSVLHCVIPKRKVPEEEILVVLKLIHHSETIEYSRVYFKESRIIVQAGPLKGMESSIKKIDKHKKRAKVKMTMMGAEQLIDFGIEIIHSNERTDM